jgi:hypothetical protein
LAAEGILISYFFTSNDDPKPEKGFGGACHTKVRHKKRPMPGRQTHHEPFIFQW